MKLSYFILLSVFLSLCNCSPNNNVEQKEEAIPEEVISNIDQQKEKPIQHAKSISQSTDPRELLRAKRAENKCMPLEKFDLCLQNPLINKIRQRGENVSAGAHLISYKCNACTHESKRLELTAESDVIYMGLIGLYDKSKNDLILARLTKDEFLEKHSSKKIAARINKIVQTTDFELVPNRSKECPKCKGGFTNGKAENLEEFYKNGGNIFSLEKRKK